MPAPQTRDRILDATLELLASIGLAKLSLEEVAAEAGVSRQTVYRHFGNRDQLLAATVLREEQGFIDRIVAASDRESELQAALEAAIRETLTAAREHPLLDRLLETEPEQLLPFLLSGSGPVLPAARPVITEVLRRFLPEQPDAHVRLVADLCTRLMISYTANPPDDDLEDVARGLAAIIVRGVAP